VPWQERDWAKWTDEERNRFLGTSGKQGGGSTTRPPAGGYGANQPPKRSRPRGTRGTLIASRLNRRLGKSETLVALAAVAVTAVFFVHHGLNEARSPSAGQSHGLVQIPDLTPVLPSPHPATVTPPAAQVPAPEYRSMHLRSSLRRRTYVTSSGTLGANVSGPVLVEARWGSGPWYRLASTNATNGAYRVRYLLDRPGLVHLRIALPDGNYLVGTVRIT
jgi:hypothetical protein